MLFAWKAKNACLNTSDLAWALLAVVVCYKIFCSKRISNRGYTFQQQAGHVINSQTHVAVVRSWHWR